MTNKNKKNQLPADLEVQQQQLTLVREILENTKANIDKTLGLIAEQGIDQAELLTRLEQTKQASEGLTSTSVGQERIVEGVFSGEKMVGADGKEYNVPANYASKSKLVEGDILKLTISKDGSFIFKQIGPIARQQLMAMLVKNESTGDWYGMADNKRWRLLTAAVTYFRAKPGDEVVILTPKAGKSQWAAVENIISNQA